jgi:UDP-N-acetylglucosamine:LPS N-acetylglucosamine transferase
MPFPEFEAGKRKLLYFSRGRGRGHAIPDLEIWRELEKLSGAGGIQVRFVSYGTGARTFEEFGHPVIDLNLPDEGSITDVTVLAGRLVGWLKPDLVVSHEEFPALPAAKIFQVPTIAILDFFGPSDWLSMRSLRFADRVIFTDRRGMYPEPEYLSGRVDYVGPVLRRFAYSRKDRGKARRELGIAADAFVVTVLPGSWTEEAAPVADLVFSAFAALPSRSPTHLIWVAGVDRAAIAAHAAGAANITVLEKDWRIEWLMVAADVAVTKVNRITLIELERLGVPSISLSHGLNPMDEQRAAQILSNRTLPAAETTGAELAKQLRRAANGAPGANRTGANLAAKRAARLLMDSLLLLGR